MSQNNLGRCLLPFINQLDEFKSLVESLGKKGIVNVSGLDESVAVAVMAALKDKTQQPFLIICENELLARLQAEDFNALGIGAKLLPSMEISFLKTDAASREISLQRLTVQTSLEAFLPAPLQSRENPCLMKYL